MNRAVDMATKILEEIKKQQGFDETSRSSGISNLCLDAMFRAVEGLRKSIKQSNLPLRESRGRTLSRMVIESWPLGTELGKKISELEDLYNALE